MSRGSKEMKEAVASLLASDLICLSQGLLALVSEMPARSTLHGVLDTLRNEVDEQLANFARRYSEACDQENDAAEKDA